VRLFLAGTTQLDLLTAYVVIFRQLVIPENGIKLPFQGVKPLSSFAYEPRWTTMFQCIFLIPAVTGRRMPLMLNTGY
jgi:hypothetical protein